MRTWEILHWLPVQQNICFKLGLVVYKRLKGHGKFEFGNIISSWAIKLYKVDLLPNQIFHNCLTLQKSVFYRNFMEPFVVSFLVWSVSFRPTVTDTSSYEHIYKSLFTNNHSKYRQKEENITSVLKFFIGFLYSKEFISYWGCLFIIIPQYLKLVFISEDCHYSTWSCNCLSLVLPRTKLFLVNKLFGFWT